MDKLWRVLYEPTRVFDEIRDDCPIMLPLAVVAVLSAIIMGLTLGVFTSDEAIKKQLEAELEAQEMLLEMNSPLVNAETIEQVRESIEDGSAIPIARMSAAIGSPIAFAIGLVLGFLLTGTYFFIVGKIVRADMGWDSWFGFACWCAMPVVIGLAVQMVLTATGSANAPTFLSPLTWFGMSDFWATYLSIPVLWSVYIAICGLQSWMDKGWVTSAIVAIIPVAVVVLIGNWATTFWQSVTQNLGMG